MLAGVAICTYCACANAAQTAELHLESLINSVHPGGTVEIPPGTYREFIQITHSGTAQKPIVVEGEGEGVVITGADRLATNRWRVLPGRTVWQYSPWTYHAPTFRVENSGPVYSGEQVIVDGKLLSRAASLDSMPAGSFLVVPADKALYVRLPDDTPPSRHMLEVSVRPMLLKITGSHIVVRNITFRYASNVAQEAAVDIGGEYNVIEDSVVENTAGVGLHLGGRHNLVRRVTSASNGQLGMGGNGQDNVLEGCRLIHNNTLNYPRDWEAGGIKVVGTDHFRISKCVAIDNNGSGFWFDINNREGIIQDSYATDNVDSGIMVEISQNITVSHNVAVRNGVKSHSWNNGGILIAESNYVTVDHNICVDNRTGIAVRQQRVRVLPADPESGNASPIRFHSYELVFRRNIAAFNRQWQFALYGDNPFFAGKYVWMIHRVFRRTDFSGDTDEKLLDPSKWNWRMDHNVYFAPPGTGLIVWGAPWLTGHTAYSSLEAFRQRHDLGQDSIVADPEFVDWRHGNFKLRLNSPALALIKSRQAPGPQD